MATATTLVWRDDLLVVSLPATAATAEAFLRRPDNAAAIAAALAAAAGRPVRHAIRLAEAAAAEPPARRPPGASQAALVRAASERPLVAHARTLFDAVIRKVEPPRPPESGPAAGAVDAVAVGPSDPSTPESETSDG